MELDSRSTMKETSDQNNLHLQYCLFNYYISGIPSISSMSILPPLTESKGLNLIPIPYGFIIINTMLHVCDSLKN